MRRSHRRQRPDELILPLAGHQAGQAQDRGRSPSPYRARSSARAAGSGRNTSVSTPGGRCSSAAPAPNADAKRPRVYLLTNVTASVVSPIRRSACGHRAASTSHIVAVGGRDHPVRARPAHRRREQCQRRRRTEPHVRALVLAHQLPGPARDERRRHHERRGMTHHPIGLLGVETDVAVTPPAGRVDHQLVRRQLGGKGVQVRLDPAGAGGKIVRHQQGSTHASTVGPADGAAATRVRTVVP